MTSRLAYLVVLFPFLGVILTAAGWKYRRHLKAKARDYQRTTAVVVGNSKSRSGGFDTTPVYQPVFEYSMSGQRYSVTGSVGYGRKKKEGAKVAILYDPKNPSEAFI
jgi:hypothetical protein